MDLKRLWFFFGLLKYTIPVFIIHLLLFQLSDLKAAAQNFYWSIPVLYLIYFVFSKIILFLLVQVSTKNFDNVGMTFLVITSAKMAVSYFIVRPILNSPLENTIEKANFFFIFILFLTIETLITIRLLNKKQ
ncbi:hypothetical protein EQG68_05050 [Flavobacterium piscinae]|uniref:Uncharacterized protein n=1 Tax=Flavobacterium piscinae TaxID=2506424 RepID=A0A4Q1KV03_9FLAO|nr:hypothetical protein EQG68_05050 [Flavobacterium piscinae]